MTKLTTVLLLLVATTAAAAPEPRALVVHVPPMVSEPDRPIELEAMLDAPFAATLEVRWRELGGNAWHDLAFARSSAGGWYAVVPGTPAGIEYYIVGRTVTGGAEVAHFASASDPHVVRADPSVTDRLESLDRTRLGDHRNEVSVDVTGHNFGNRFDLPDRYVRAELGFTHRLLRTLHQIKFGFGSISGTTPVVSEEGGTTVGKALRYGFGEIRVRAHPSVFLDARASLGVSDEGFDQGARGVITFGKPWRSNLAVGGEVTGDLGNSAWVRLQWDTSAPFLMGASITRTDLPGSVIDTAGLFLGYDVAYTIAERFTMRAQLSYGARDGASHFGGGLGTALAF
ncbi:MAG: hypothetical protein ABI867_30880 [Kofleriaceae bacterium]